jgi:hypothetical protein
MARTFAYLGVSEFQSWPEDRLACLRATVCFQPLQANYRTVPQNRLGPLLCNSYSQYFLYFPAIYLEILSKHS